MHLLIWCIIYCNTHFIAASFSLFEDNNSGSTGKEIDSIKLDPTKATDDTIRQAIPPSKDNVNQDGIAPSPGNDKTTTIPVPGYKAEEGKAQEEEEDDLMYYLTQYRARARRTVEGNLCASAFVEKNQIYTDCTKEIAPDGTQDREWCYHESQLNGKLERDWGFCEPPLNYEKIRRAVITKIQEKVEQAQELKETLNKHRSLLGNMEKRLQMFCGVGHKNIELSLTRLEELLNGSEEDLKEMQAYSNDIQAIKKELKREQCRYQAVKNMIPSDVLSHLSDGLVGTYFAGHLFEFPAYGSRVDRELNFVFSDFMPIIGLNPHCFSVIWSGYIKAPHSGNFVFTVETTSYVRMELDGVAIINNGIVKQGSDEEGYKYSIDTIMRGATLTSQSQQLVGGRFYRIQIEFSHSQQFHYRSANSVLKLEWSSTRVPREVIKDYLYTKATPPGISISYLSHDHFAINEAYNGALAHMDDKGTFIANMSNDLVSTQMVTTLRSPEFKTFVMQVNMSCTMYVAYIAEVFPISAVTSDALKFKDAANTRVDLVDKEGKVSNTKVKQATLMKNHTYKFNVEVAETPFVIFLSEKVKLEPAQVVGPVTVVSIPDSEFYLTCEESSRLNDSFGCEAGLSGKLIDKKGAIWRSNDGVGAWLKVIFRHPILLSGFQLKQSDDPSRWVRRLSLEFEDTMEYFDILHSNDPKAHHYYLSEPRKVTSVVMRVEELYLNSNSTAVAINLLGQKIKEESGSLTRVFMNCSDTLENNIDVQPLAEGHAYELICNRKCLSKGELQSVGDVLPMSTPPCSALNIDLCRHGGHPQVCHASLTIVRSQRDDKRLGFVISRLDKHIRTTPFATSILFKAASNRLPQHDFLVDNGAMKAPVDPSYLQRTSGNAKMGEVSYGWLRPNVHEGNALGIAFPPAGESEKCIQKPGCQPNFWSLDVPRNGKYKVELVVGDTSQKEQWLSVELNGESLIDCINVPQGSLYTIVKEVEVNNNRLKITSTSRNKTCNNQRTTLQFFKIKEL